MDHALSSYSIRCLNPDDKDGRKRNNHRLDNICERDLYALLTSFIQSRVEFKKVESKKQVYKFDEVHFDKVNRVISGWMHYGKYGVRSEIININSNKKEFDKQTQNADMSKFFFQFWIPFGTDGISLFHTIKKDGVKSIFHSEFQEYFTRVIPGRVLQLNSLTYEKALQKWVNASITEIKALRFKGHTDIADVPTSFGGHHIDYVIRPHKNSRLGKLSSILSESTDEAALVEELDELSDDIVVSLELDGIKKKKLRIGRNSRKALCEIVLTEDVELIDGMPTLSSLRKFSNGILLEFIDKLHPRRGLS